MIGKTNFWIIRFATPSDAHAIVDLNNQETTDLAAETGFILSKLSYKCVENALLSLEHGYIVAEMDGDQVCAFLRIVDAAPSDVMSELIWVDVSSRNQFESADPKYIERIVVGKDYRRRSIGRDLYTFSETVLAHKGLYMFACLSPVENRASIQFHEIIGFKKAAIFKRGMFYGLENYQSVLMHKGVFT